MEQLEQYAKRICDDIVSSFMESGKPTTKCILIAYYGAGEICEKAIKYLGSGPLAGIAHQVDINSPTDNLSVGKVLHAGEQHLNEIAAAPENNAAAEWLDEVRKGTTGASCAIYGHEYISRAIEHKQIRKLIVMEGTDVCDPSIDNIVITRKCKYYDILLGYGRILALSWYPID